MRGRARGLLAAGLQLVVLGLGDVYNGETRRGVSLFALSLAVNVGGFMVWSPLLIAAPSVWTLAAYLPVLLFSVGLYLYGSRRAYARAVRLEELPRRRLRRCLAYALCAWLVSEMGAYLMRSGSLQ